METQLKNLTHRVLELERWKQQTEKLLQVITAKLDADVSLTVQRLNAIEAVVLESSESKTNADLPRV